MASNEDPRPPVERQEQESSSTKRSRDSESPPSTSTTKKLRIHEPSTARLGHISGPHLLSLPDSLILSILAQLPEVQDRLNLAQCSRTLNSVVRDHTNWKNVQDKDTTHSPMYLRELKKMLDFFSDVTKSVSIRGFLETNERTTINVSESFFDKLIKKCPNLRHLELKDCLIDRSRVTIHALPSTLRRLALKDCELINPPSGDSWFRNLHTTLTSLTQLDLSGCGGWIRNHCLMAMCKSETLEDLNLRGCFGVGEAFAYTAIATGFGFRNLRKLDVRDTNCGQSEVSSFGGLPRLECLKLGLTDPDFDRRPEEHCESDGTITDKGLQVLLTCITAETPSLISELTITHSPEVSNRITTELAQKLPLAFLDVRGTAIGTVGEAAILKQRPECQVILAPIELGEGEVQAPAVMPAAMHRIVVFNAAGQLGNGVVHE